MTNFQQVMRKNRDTPELLPGVDVPPISIESARALMSVGLANHIPVPRGKAEPPDFTDDPAAFDAFIERNFPRSTFASLRKVLDKPYPRSWAISIYREIVRVGKLLRAATVLNDALARLKGECPPLRICDCGKLFVPQRKDQKMCSRTCRDRVRQANWRANSKRYKANRVWKENEAEKQRKAREQNGQKARNQRQLLLQLQVVDEERRRDGRAFPHPAMRPRVKLKGRSAGRGRA
jgi:hypothetical protein